MLGELHPTWTSFVSGPEAKFRQNNHQILQLHQDLKFVRRREVLAWQQVSSLAGEKVESQRISEGVTADEGTLRPVKATAQMFTWG